MSRRGAARPAGAHADEASSRSCKELREGSGSRERDGAQAQEADKEAEKEKRIAHTQEMAVRSASASATSRAAGRAWYEMWPEKACAEEPAQEGGRQADEAEAGGVVPAVGGARGTRSSTRSR